MIRTAQLSKWALQWFILACMLTGCHKRQPTPPKPPAPEIASIRPQDAFDDVCQRGHNGEEITAQDVKCQGKGFMSARDLVIDLWEAAAIVQAQLEEAKAHANIDISLALADADRARLERDDAKADRWTWALTGTGIGAALGALITALIFSAL